MSLCSIVVIIRKKDKKKKIVRARLHVQFSSVHSTTHPVTFAWRRLRSSCAMDLFQRNSAGRSEDLVPHEKPIASVVTFPSGIHERFCNGWIQTFRAQRFGGNRFRMILQAVVSLPSGYFSVVQGTLCKREDY